MVPGAKKALVHLHARDSLIRRDCLGESGRQDACRTLGLLTFAPPGRRSDRSRRRGSQNDADPQAENDADGAFATLNRPDGTSVCSFGLGP
jgi:hypothetical protein